MDSSIRVDNRDVAERESILSRYLALFPVRTEGWHQQVGYGSPWPDPKRPLTDEVILRHLGRNEEYWFASRSPVGADGATPVTPFLLLDFDSKRDPLALERVRRVAEAFEIPPLLQQSPGGGFHAIWFFDRTLPLTELQLRGHSEGLLPDALGYILEEKTGPGICEIYPQPNSPIRWPFGFQQELVEVATGAVKTNMDAPALIRDAEVYRANTPVLTLERLTALRPARIHPVSLPQPKSLVKPEINPRIYRIAPATAWEGERFFVEGLQEQSSRNPAMFKIALLMVHAPDILVPYGFKPERDPAEQLLRWLEAKHNGNSGDYAGPEAENREWWLEECRRVVRDARNRGPLETVPAGSLMLSEKEWDTVLDIGGESAVKQSQRHRLEIVAASVLRKAKWSVVNRGFDQNPDGTFPAEIHSDWWAEIEFCRSHVSRRKYRGLLEEAGLFWTAKKGAKHLKRATIYDGFPLDFRGPWSPLEYSPRTLAQVAGEIGVGAPVLEYGLKIEQRFPTAESRVKRYGKFGNDYIESTLARTHASVIARAA